MISTNFFARDTPTESGNAFSNAISESTNQFSNADPLAVNDVPWEGDNVSGSVYGNDYGTMGTMYGQGDYGGFTHFLNRTTPPSITHG